MSPVAKRIELHDVKHGKSGDTLSVGRSLVDAPSVIRSGNGLYPFGLEISKVGLGEKTIVLVREPDNGIRDRAAVEGVGAVLRNQAKTVGNVRVAKDLPNPGIGSTRKKGSSEGGPVLEVHTILGPVFRIGLSDGKTVFSQRDGWGKVDSERQFAELCVQRLPACNGPGNGNSIDAGAVHLCLAFGLHGLDGLSFGGPATGIEGVHLLLFRVPYDGK